MPPPLETPLVAAGTAAPGDTVVAALDQALDRVPSSGALVRLQAPLPPSEPFPEGRLSPRLAVLLAQALDAGGVERVLLVGDPFVSLAAALLHLPVPPERVLVMSRHAGRAQWTARRLGLDDDARVAILDAADPVPRGPYDRILLAGDAHDEDDHLADHLAPSGVLVTADWRAKQTRMTQQVRFEGEETTLDLTRHWVGPEGVPKERAHPHRTPLGATIGRILLVERMQENAWKGMAVTPTEQGVLQAVRETFVGGAGADADALLVGDATLDLARRLFHLAYIEQVAGTRPVAGSLYRSSLSVCETSEGWTFYGWVRSQDGSFQEAIDACRRAIALDSDFGNPYNDIGAYLMADGREDEAKVWFERATQAPRYAAPHYPYTNLGRAYLREGDLMAAREAVEHALDLMPGYRPAERLLKEIETLEENDPSQR